MWQIIYVDQIDNVRQDCVCEFSKLLHWDTGMNIFFIKNGGMSCNKILMNKYLRL